MRRLISGMESNVMGQKSNTTRRYGDRIASRAGVLCLGTAADGGRSRSWRLTLTGLVAAVTFGLLASASLAQAAGPAWTLSSDHFPTKLQPGEKVFYAFVASNVGTSSSTGAVTVTVTLPPGVTATATAGGWSCPGAVGQNVITCTATPNVPAGQVTSAISITATVPAGASGTLASTATITGGGTAAPATASDAAPVGVPAPFGIAGFSARAYDQTGRDVTQAGGHPWMATTKIALNTVATGNGVANVEDARTLTVDLPPGFIGNPQATTRCPIALHSVSGFFSSCPPASIVGRLTLLQATGIPPGTVLQSVPVYNLAPEGGHAGEFGFTIAGTPQILYAGVRSDGNYQLSVVADKTPVAIGQAVMIFTFYGQPGAFNGTGSTEPFLSNPTDCSVVPVTKLTVDSWYRPDAPAVSRSYVSPAITGCDRLPFAPAFTAAPSSSAPDAPTGLGVGLSFPQDGLVSEDGLATAHLKRAVVALPQGMSIDPAAADGLVACSDVDLRLHSLAPMSCPDGSKIGTATATSPLLDEPLTGGVYVRSQNSMDPESGQMFRIALVLESKERGVSVRLPGQVRADAKTGQLTATFDNNPQLPVDDIKLQFKSGSRAPLATPKVCGKHTIDAQLSSWAGQQRDLSSAFTLGCPAGLGWFGPYFSAGTVSPVAGASTSFVLRTDKPDGQSDMNAIALSLPEGLIASLKGNVGRQIGTASVGAGPGPTPFWLSGPVVLEGPYGDAPFSLRVTVPVIAGPFNLGDVMVRQKIYVDPHDAHVTVVSDPLPTIVKGVPVRLQNLQVDIDKAGFMRNPTSCAPKSIGGTLGADTGQTAAVASRFEVGACASLPLKPKMAMELKGSKQIKRGKHPEFSTTLTQQPGESNLKSVKVRLPLSLALDPDNAEALCKPEQAAAKACPAASIVGHATAISPVLNQPLTGDVFFVEGTRQSKEGRTVKTLPRLWVALRGEVAIDVWADSSISDGKYLVTTFPFVPDAPISSFKLDINGGDHGILAVTGDVGANLCQRRLITNASYVGQNGKQVQSKVHMDSPCGFKVRQKSVSISHAKVTVSGIGAGKLTISGKGIHKATRTIKHSKVATLKPRLTAAGKRLYKGRKAIRLRVSFNPKAKGQKTKTTKTTVKRAKKESSTRGHRSSRTR